MPLICHVYQALEIKQRKDSDDVPYCLNWKLKNTNKILEIIILISTQKNNFINKQ